MDSEAQGARAAHAGTDPLVGVVLAGRYRIDAFLGRGARGSVYAAEHVLLHKPVAVKVLHRDLTKVPEIMARFEREAAAAANVDHPNIAAAIDFGRLDDGTAYLALELVRGESLRDTIAQGPLAVERVLHIVRQIAAGLAAAHAREIVHRDLKPENILLTSKDGVADVVKILDFGVAKVTGGPTGRPLTQVGVVLGTSDYMAPEQALARGADARSDLYSLGVIAYEMLAGRRPFHDCDENALLERQLAGPPPPPSAQLRDLVVPPAVEAVVMKLLSTSAAGRYQSASELISELSEPARTEVQAPSPTRFYGSLANALTVDALAATDVAPTSVSSTTKAGAKRPWRRAGARVVERAGSLRHRVVRLLGAAAERIGAERAPLPQALRKRLRRVSTRVKVSLVVLLAVTLAAGLALVIASGRSESPAPVLRAPTSSTPAAPSRPPDPRSLAQIELAETHVKQRKWSAAVAAIGEALARDPTSNRNERAAAVLAETACHEASAKATFALLQGPMAQKGAEIVYDLAARPQTPQKTRLRAEEWLGSEQFRRVASPALAIAGQMRTARRCQEKHALLAFARELGDRRALDYLKVLAVRAGCGRGARDDCYPCLRKDSALADAVAAIERRLGHE